MTAECHRAYYRVNSKVPIATEAGWRYDACVTASQASFNRDRSPDTQTHTPPGYALAKAIVVSFGCALLSTLIEGLSISRKAGNRPSQPYFADYLWHPVLFRQW